MKKMISPEELEIMLGENVKSLRLQKNIDRRSLCARAGVSENAVRNLENGRGATIKTLTRVIKALNRESWIEQVAPKTSINPLHIVRDNKPRQRASRNKYGEIKKV